MKSPSNQTNKNVQEQRRYFYADLAGAAAGEAVAAGVAAVAAAAAGAGAVEATEALASFSLSSLT